LVMYGHALLCANVYCPYGTQSACAHSVVELKTCVQAKCIAHTLHTALRSWL